MRFRAHSYMAFVFTPEPPIYDWLNSPVILSNAASAPARAYRDAARRLKGEKIPMLVPSERRGLFDKLFGRRAA